MCVLFPLRGCLLHSKNHFISDSTSNLQPQEYSTPSCCIPNKNLESWILDNTGYAEKKTPPTSFISGIYSTYGLA